MSQKKEVYLDTAATTKPDPQVLIDFVKYADEFPYNPSSIHDGGMKAKNQLTMAREKIAKECCCGVDEVFFTSSGTEGNSMILRGFFETLPDNEIGVLITSQVEHPSVLRVAEYLEKKYGQDRIRVYYISVNKGQDDSLPFVLDYEGIEETIKSEIADGVNPSNILVSIQGVNNELGCVFSTYDIEPIIKKYGCFFHSDKVQEAPHFGFRYLAKECDAITVSGHKFGALRGVGFVVIKKPLQEHISPLFLGGGQEYGMRSGTENVAGICAMADQVERYNDMLPNLHDVIRNYESLMTILDNSGIDYTLYHSATSIFSITFHGVDASSLVSLLSERGIYISSGSACHSYNPEPSHVLKAIGLSDVEALCTVRICCHKDITLEDWEYFIKWLVYYIKVLKGE